MYVDRLEAGRGPGATSTTHDWLLSPRPSHKEAQSTGGKTRLLS